MGAPRPTRANQPSRYRPAHKDRTSGSHGILAFVPLAPTSTSFIPVPQHHFTTTEHLSFSVSLLFTHQFNAWPVQARICCPVCGASVPAGTSAPLVVAAWREDSAH